MEEMAKTFVGKDCVVFTIREESPLTGTLREVRDGALLLEKDGNRSLVNLEFVVRLQEHPVGKSGKKKLIVE
ncbi:MAG: hypothetical protein LUJ09_07560 [Firmicutes bacterium]|nr:hypothetical protein [Bacillota bacterium]